MRINFNLLTQVSGKNMNDNMASALRGLDTGGKVIGIQRPHRLAMFLAQVCHESGGWHWDKEIWGPTAAQKRYDTRTDLGNTPQVDGDGKKYMGRTGIQITGKYNYTKFYNWAVRTFTNMSVPNFVDYPEQINTDPWEGLGPLWYWAEGKSNTLNNVADKGDFKLLTYLINGGYNGLADRYRYYGRAAMVLLGKDPNGIRAIQAQYGIKQDGVVGEKTAAVLHQLLLKLPDVDFGNTGTSTGTGSGFFAAIARFFSSIMGK